MMPSQIFRLIHTNSLLSQSNKSLLAKLRRKTGYTFSNCRKALTMHDNDVEKAESWLREQAQQYGWTQAAKLQNRNTTQGVIAVAQDRHHVVLGEINCETDFVAQNKKFLGLAETMMNAVLNHVKKQKIENEIQRILYHSDSLKDLQATDGKRLDDHTAMTIGSVSENITLTRALVISVPPSDILLYGSAHPLQPPATRPLSFGRYGALVAVKWKKGDPVLASQLCQHIIGMNPEKVGNISVDEPHDDINEESCMIYQEFLFDSNISVQELMNEVKGEIIDFARFEIGESSRSQS